MAKAVIELYRPRGLMSTLTKILYKKFMILEILMRYQFSVSFYKIHFDSKILKSFCRRCTVLEHSSLVTIKERLKVRVLAVNIKLKIW